MRVVAGEQKAEVELKPRTLFKPEEFRAAIEQAGQKVRSFELVLCATVEKREGRYYLQPAEVAQRFGVSGNDAARKLEGLVGKPVCLRGKLASTRPPLSLEILDVAVLPPAERRTPSPR